MAKQAKSSGTSRIRFVMVDAEISEGDVGSITQAIQNALRGPAGPVVQRIASPPAKPHEVNGSSVPEMDADFESEVEQGDAAVETAPRPRVARKPAPKPSVIEIDISSEPPLSSIGTPKSNHRRYLAIAAWLHDHRGIEAITSDHIYTCYRHLGWPTDILDFAQPLRELKHKQFFTTPERGKYAINQLGLAKAAEADSE
jgi:hypothetical protein